MRRVIPDATHWSKIRRRAAYQKTRRGQKDSGESCRRRRVPEDAPRNQYRESRWDLYFEGNATRMWRRAASGGPAQEFYDDSAWLFKKEP